MKAVIQNEYGSPDLLEVQDIDRPTIGDDEVLVRVRATSVHPDVWHVVTGRPYVLRLMGAGFSRPKNPVPGTDFAGHVEAVGRNVTRFSPGDAVFGESIRGMQWINGGAFAEYVCAPQDCLAHKPDNVSFVQAATVPTAGFITLLNLNNQGLEPGQKVLVNGAGGGVGAIALQIAKARGAHVTGVDHTKKLGLVRSLGADVVIDYTQEDFTQGSERYDLVFDIPGNHSFAACRRVLTPTGKYVLIGHDHFGANGRSVLGLIPRMFKLMALSVFVRQLPNANFKQPSKQETLATLKELLETGKLTPIVDRTYSLNEVAEAMRYLAQGQPLGRIVLTP